MLLEASRYVCNFITLKEAIIVRPNPATSAQSHGIDFTLELPPSRFAFLLSETNTSLRISFRWLGVVQRLAAWSLVAA